MATRIIWTSSTTVYTSDTVPCCNMRCGVRDFIARCNTPLYKARQGGAPVRGYKAQSKGPLGKAR